MRVYRVFKATKAPLPILIEEDEVLDYLAKEALVIKDHTEQEEARKKKEREDWKKNKPGSDPPTAQALN